MIRRMIKPLILNLISSDIVLMPKTELSPIVTAVPKIKATTQGFTPPINALTLGLLRSPEATEAIIRIITNDGKTTPKVAKNEPNIPP